MAPLTGEIHELQAEVERLRLLHAVGLELNASLEFDSLLSRVFERVLATLGAEGGSLWIAEGEMLHCRLAAGGAAQRLVGAEMPVGTGFVGDVAQKQKTTIVTQAGDDPRFRSETDRAGESLASTVMATAMVVGGETIGAIQVVNKREGAGLFDEHDREILEGLAATAAVALRNARLHTAERRARDLALLLEISREITATLDLDRVLRSVVNLASRAVSFERGAVALYEKGVCEIRAIAGQDTVDPKDAKLQDLAVRAAWAAGRGETFYVRDALAPATDAERTFAQIFGPDLEADGMRSGLYLPLADEAGTLGVLLLEAERPEFASDTQVELAEILSNQTAVALRNAQLYNQVPLVDTLGALAEKKRALLAIPRRRLQLAAVGAALLLALVTLVRWPLRVPGEAPRFLPLARAEARAMVPGLVEQVLVDEGAAVARGTPLVRLRDAELRAERAARAADAAAMRQAAAAAASRGDAAEERIQRLQAAGVEREVAVLDEALAATLVRAPVGGVVLTPRLAERVGARLEPGDLVATLGRLDTLELELGVDQRDVARVAPGAEVRLRVDALPQRTFSGRVASVGELPVDDGPAVRYPVRALVPNAAGLLRPGMPAHARVLTAPASIAGRLTRGPARWIRLAWWRLWS